jgi:hypothetical protein
MDANPRPAPFNRRCRSCRRRHLQPSPPTIESSMDSPIELLDPAKSTPQSISSAADSPKEPIAESLEISSVESAYESPTETPDESPAEVPEEPMTPKSKCPDVLSHAEDFLVESLVHKLEIPVNCPSDSCEESPAVDSEIPEPAAVQLVGIFKPRSSDHRPPDLLGPRTSSSSPETPSLCTVSDESPSAPSSPCYHDYPCSELSPEPVVPIILILNPESQTPGYP